MGLLLILLCFIPSQQMNASVPPPYILGGAGILIDSENGQALYVKEPHKHMYPASTTKILTAIIAIENTELDDIVLIPAEASNIEGSSIGLHEGELITIEDLLYAMMLNSGNDAAVAIAVYVGGSVSDFVDIMNSKAAELGAVDSHFNNPNGLPDENHYTSAYDLSLIARYAMKNKTFREIVSTQTKVINRTFPEAQTNLVNSSRLFSRYPGTIGIKTGYTEAAGQCLIAATVKGNRELISVVLGSEGVGIYDDTIALMEYGYNQYNKVSVIEKGTHIADVQVKNGAPDYVEVAASMSINYDIPVENSQTIDKDVYIYEGIAAPIELGAKLGEVVFYNEDVEIGRADLLAGQDVSRTWTSYWQYALCTAALLLVIRLIFFIRRRARRRYFAKRKIGREQRLLIK